MNREIKLFICYTLGIWNVLYKISNGRTLCKPCHKLTENYGYTKQNGKSGHKI